MDHLMFSFIQKTAESTGQKTRRGLDIVTNGSGCTRTTDMEPQGFVQALQHEQWRMILPTHQRLPIYLYRTITP